MQKNTNANPQAISSARAHKPAAAAVSSTSPTNTSAVAPPEFEPKVSPPPPPFASDRWAAGGASSSDEEEDVKNSSSKKGAVSKRAPAAKKKSKGKDKYLVAPPSENKADPEFMPPKDFDDDDALPPAAFDPFADEAAADGAGPASAGDDGRVHLRVQQRNGRKTLTTVQGLSTGYNYAKVLRDLKRDLCCNGTVVEDKELGNVIQLQGDHRKKVAAFLAKAGLAKTDCIKVHGF